MNIYYQQFSHLESNKHFLNRYLKIISIFKERNLSKAKNLENHHIFPKSFGGSNKKENLVYCTIKEHFILHHLLWKSFPGNQSMNYAFFRMSHTKKYKNRITSRVFEQLRTEFDEQNKKPQSLDHIKKRADAMRGRPLSSEHIKKVVISLTGRTLSDEHIKKMSESNKGRIISDETKQKMSDAKKGKPRPTITDVHRKNLSDSNKGKIKINNGFNEKKINPELLQEHLNKGWFIGGIKGKIIINNGVEQKMVTIDDAENIFYPLGFVKGKLPK